VREIYLALHLSGIFLTEKNRRILERAANIEEFAHIILAERFALAIKQSESRNSEPAITLEDELYPALLKSIDYAPFAFFVKGNANLLANNKISIVGTREPSEAGRQATVALAAHFTRKNLTIVSGIARGVDAIAHHSALKARGSTIAVLPNGFGHLYPLENRDIYAEADNNPHVLLLSEYPHETKPQKHHFVRRNRIIAGLSGMTVFVEGALKSGGMITVNYALKEGREVGALMHEQLTQNAGGQRLISEGAHDLTHIFAESLEPA